MAKVEQAIHEGMQKVIQNIWDEYQICVRTVSVNWVDLSTLEEPRMMVTGLNIETSTKVGPSGKKL